MSRPNPILSAALLVVCVAMAAAPTVANLIPGLGLGGILGGCSMSSGHIPRCFEEVVGQGANCLLSSQNLLGCLDKGLKAFRQPGPKCCWAFLDVYNKCWPKGLPTYTLLTAKIDYCKSKVPLVPN
ncbi:hypothetical protein NMG60_11013189 [Bertholletia excelsa]